jgi:hypothetical protein
MIGHDRLYPVPMWRRKLVKMVCQVTAHIVLGTNSIIFKDDKEFEYDYSEYLGPDWKPYYENAGSIVSNHQSFLDI